MSTETTLTGIGPDESLDAVGIESPIAGTDTDTDHAEVTLDIPGAATGVVTVEIAEGAAGHPAPLDLVFETWDAASDLFVFAPPEQPQTPTLTFAQDDTAASSDGAPMAELLKAEPADAPASAALLPDAGADAAESADATDSVIPAPVDSSTDLPPAEADDTAAAEDPAPADATVGSGAVIGDDQGGGAPVVDDGDLILTIMPVGTPEPVLPFEPVICVDPPFLELPPICVICPAPLEEVGALYYAELLTTPEASNGFTDASIPAALAA